MNGWSNLAYADASLASRRGERTLRILGVAEIVLVVGSMVHHMTFSSMLQVRNFFGMYVTNLLFGLDLVRLGARHASHLSVAAVRQPQTGAAPALCSRA